MTQPVAVRLRAVLDESHAVPDPANKRPGRGSVVTVIAILPPAPKEWEPRMAYAFDEWGRFLEVYLGSLVFEGEPSGSDLGSPDA